MIDYGQRVIKVIRDVDFMEWPEAEEDSFIDKNDNIVIHFHEKHGTVIYLAGMCEDEDDLVCMGSEDGKNFRIAAYNWQGLCDGEKEQAACKWYKHMTNDWLKQEAEE